MDSMADKEVFFVAAKIFLRDNDKLLIIHDTFGDWDLPGGRIKKDEFETPLEAVLERKIREEIGPEVKYELGGPKAFFRVEREEHGIHGNVARIFAVGFEGQYKGGNITLGDYHDQMEWVSLKTFAPEEYFTGGWLKGVQDYMRATVRVPRDDDELYWQSLSKYDPHTAENKDDPRL